MKLAATQKGLCFGLALLGAMVLPFKFGAAVYAEEVVPIYDIQDAGHISPYAGQTVTTTGVVTAVAFNGYYVQDSVGDGDDATSDGIFVFKTGSKPAVGDFVVLTDRVTEFIPGGAGWPMGGLETIKGRPMLALMGEKDKRLPNFKALEREALCNSILAST